jgi:glutamate N-acetyltransferase/amino-acid N-acetyltransferase
LDLNGLKLARGYRFAGVASGLRSEPGRLDLALVCSDRPASAAGVFTQNRVVAAPVQVCRQRLPAGDARGVVICSGNANACTGKRGLDDAFRMTALAAEAIECRPEQMLVCSTGVIGRQLPMDRVEKGIRQAGGELEASGAALARAARAILTTDTHIKVSSRLVSLAGHDYRLTGVAKGAAMIGPNLATMLAFLLTDAPLSAESLQPMARALAESSFNSISVDGHTSTNDSLLLFANGSGAMLAGSDLTAFGRAAGEVCSDLARAIAADAEGASHLVRIEVEGLRNQAEAKRVAKAVADSPLVKTAMFGGDPNWGRIVSAAGYAGVAFAEGDLSLQLGPFLLYEKGTPLVMDELAAARYLRENREVVIRLVFTLGKGCSAFWTCDLTYDYVKLNAEYTT